MELICYSISGEPPPEIVPAPVQRQWMDTEGNGSAYRCLPLNIANAHGWLILNPAPFVAEWNGSAERDGVVVRPTAPGRSLIGSSHFGAGILTFTVNALFTTSPGYDLVVTGPFNQPKDAIQPLTGIVETDWAPFTFTMNWKFTRNDTQIAFESGEPFCMIFPVRRGLVEEVETDMRPIESNEGLFAAYTAWVASRRAFHEGLAVPGSEAQVEKWQKDYFRGASRFGQSPPDHRTKLRVKSFPIQE